MAYVFKKGDTPGAVAVKLGGVWSDWQSNFYKLPDGTIVPGSSLNPNTVPIGTTALTAAEYQSSGGAGTTPTTPTTPPVDPNAPITDTPPAEVGGTTIPQGAKIVVVRNPEGSDAAKLWYLVYEWNGIEIAYEVGDDARFVELFGPASEFTVASNITVVNQAPFDDAGYVLAGSVDQIVGSTESLGSQIEREIKALGMEDLPEWMKADQDTLLLLATATAQDWSSGRLWQELSGTTGFEERYGAVLSIYTSGGIPIGEAIQQIHADEAALKNAIKPYASEILTQGTPAEQTSFIQELMLGGWTPGAAAQVLEQADILRSDPESFQQANLILEASGLGSIDEIEFVNALAGFGVPDVVEALNTAAAATALADAGLEDVDIDLLMEVVDTSGSILTVESFASLAQELALNTVRFSHELDTTKLGFTRDDLIAAAFGETNPNGKTPGEVINALARFQRDRQAAGSGFEQTTGFQDEKGRLRIAGLGSL